LSGVFTRKDSILGQRLVELPPMLTWVFRHRSRLGRIYGSPACTAPVDSRAFGEGLDLPAGQHQEGLEQEKGVDNAPPDAGQVHRRSRWVLLRPMVRPRFPGRAGEDDRQAS
jgi:hypothetical protein